jgi:Outer membrane protein beta-barrel domain
LYKKYSDTPYITLLHPKSSLPNMKKIFVAFCTVLTFSSTHAQSFQATAETQSPISMRDLPTFKPVAPPLSSQDWHFGFQLSPTLSWMNSDSKYIQSVSKPIGLKLGVLAEKHFADNYALTTGIGFHFNTGGGLKHDYAGTFWTNSYGDFNPRPAATDTFVEKTLLKYNLQFLEIPLGLRMRTQEFGYMRYFLEPLLTFGIRTQARGSIVGSSNNGKFDQEKINIKEAVNAINLSWGFGGGVEYTISQNTVVVGGLYFNRGFTDMTSDSDSKLITVAGGARTAEEAKSVINNLTIRLGIMF